MKKQLFFIAIAGLFSSLASATDLYVRDAGAGGAYSTIAAAIAAATDGDRIIIRPKTGGLPYIGDFTINKSLSFVSEINFTKYAVQGLITFDPAAGRTISIHNINITGNIGFNTTIPFITGGRCNLNILNSLITGSLIANTSGTSLNLSGCILTQEVRFVHGKLCGNDFGLYKYVYLSDEDSNLNIVRATTPSYLNANKLSYLELSSFYYNYSINNNYFRHGNSTGSLGTNIFIASIRPNSTNNFTNNYFDNYLNSVSTNYNIRVGVNSTTGVLQINNNYFNMGTNANAIRKTTFNNNLLVYIDYNMTSVNTSFPANNELIIGNNNLIGIFNGGAPIAVSGAAIDAGDPTEEYSDLNLTRNDIGAGGGSDAWSNYWSASATQAQVMYLDIPSRIYQGTTTLQVEGLGYSK